MSSRCVRHRLRAPIIDFLPIGGLLPAEVAAILQGSSKDVSSARIAGPRDVPHRDGIQGSLDSYAKKSDCFRRAASMLQTRCGDLETDENARVRGASDTPAYGFQT